MLHRLTKIKYNSKLFQCIPSVVKKRFCAVCGDKATKLRYSHYGAVSCFSCRTFFRRSVEKGQVFTCQWSSKCKIDRVTRRKCTGKYCLEAVISKVYSQCFVNFSDF